ncbi:MAG: hypothetical protein ACODAJ_06755 [Planctomycetota bacterium]
MYRYKLTAFFEDKETEARVAQLVIVIAENDQQAVAAAKETVAPDAVGGRLATLKVLEKSPVEPGVVHRGVPYIPFQWPGQRALPKIAPAPSES